MTLQLMRNGYKQGLSEEHLPKIVCAFSEKEEGSISLEDNQLKVAYYLLENRKAVLHFGGRIRRCPSPPRLKCTEICNGGKFPLRL